MATKKRPRTLTAAYIRRTTEPGRYGDGHGSRGLSLRVKRIANGRVSKRWQQQTRLPDGRWTTLSLGPYPEIGLREARLLALKNSREIVHGRDPRAPKLPSFRAAAESHIERIIAPSNTGQTVQDWRNVLTTYAYPRLGSVRVDRVTTAHVLAVLEPVWLAKPSVGKKLRRRLSAVMQAAQAAGHRTDDPAGVHILKALPVQNGRTRHHDAVAVKDAPAMFARMADADHVSDPVRLAAMFVALTGARSAEVRGARWSEINFDSRTWSLPASRTKSRTERRIPLSGPALDVLATLTRSRDGFIFEGRKRGAPLSSAGVGAFVKRETRATIHGWRSTLRSWCAEAGISREVAESVLGHATGNAVEQSYQRSDLYRRRRDVMDRWGKHIVG